MSRKLMSGLSIAVAMVLAPVATLQPTSAQQPDRDSQSQLPQADQIPPEQPSDLPFDDPSEAQQAERGDQDQPRSGQPDRQLDQQRQQVDGVPQQRTDAARDQQPRQGRSRPAGLGVAVVPDADGVRVARVYPDSAADVAGIREGDRIVEIDGQPIGSVNDLLTTVRQSEPGQTVQVAIDRGGQRQSLEAMLQTRAEALQDQFRQPQFQRSGGATGAPWTDDLAAHIDMLEQEIRRLSDEVADLKAMLMGSPEQQSQRQPGQSQVPSPSGDQASRSVDRFDQEIRGQSPDGADPVDPGQVNRQFEQTSP